MSYDHYDHIHLTNRDPLLKTHKVFLTDKVFLEFGVFRGTSMLMWYDLYQRNNLPIDFVGFDSFQGLPEEKEDTKTIWRTGMFTTDGNVNPALNKPGIRLIQGFYNSSLTQAAAESLQGKKVGLVHIDCDTYSSTKTVWEWILKYDLLAKGALIVYDDWGAWLEARCNEDGVGEAKAHKEIEEKYSLHFKDLGKYIVNPSFYEVKIYQYEGKHENY